MSTFKKKTGKLILNDDDFQLFAESFRKEENIGKMDDYILKLFKLDECRTKYYEVVQGLRIGNSHFVNQVNDIGKALSRIEDDEGFNSVRKVKYEIDDILDKMEIINLNYILFAVLSCISVSVTTHINNIKEREKTKKGKYEYLECTLPLICNYFEKDKEFVCNLLTICDSFINKTNIIGLLLTSNILNESERS